MSYYSLFDNMEPMVRAQRVGMTRKRPTFDDGTISPAKRILRVLDIVQLPKNTYQYLPLNPDEDTRVLILDPGEGNDDIKCRLEPCVLPSTEGRSKEKYNYEALSYFWGQEDARTPIQIRNASNQQIQYAEMGRSNYSFGTYYIRPNLHSALLQLRHKTRYIVLWVDTLCINQEDPSEKTKQVSRMHEIYSEAKNVCIWLGSPTLFDAKDTFEFLREIVSDLGTLDQLASSEKSANRWVSLINLMRNRWFSRRWVIQELALAKDASVHCGAEVIKWVDFKDAIALFGTKHDEVKKLLKLTRRSGIVGEMKALGAHILADVTNNLFRRSGEGKILEKLSSLEVLVSSLLFFEATDPKDTIYAVLSIAKDTAYASSEIPGSPASTSSGTPDLRITPDYTKSLSDVLTDFIDYCIETSKSLDIICRHWAPKLKARSTLDTVRSGPKAEEIMPSWIPSVMGSAFGDPETTLIGRINGDSLVGTPNRQNYRTYNASAGLEPCVSFGREAECENLGDYYAETVEQIIAVNEDTASQPSSNTEVFGDNTASISSPSIGTHPASVQPDTKNGKSKSDGTLSVKGIRLGTISKLSRRVAQGMIFSEYLEMGGWKYDDTLETVPEPLWRTLVADRGPNSTNAPSWYQRACMQCLTSVPPNGYLYPGALIATDTTPSTMVSFLERVERVVWDRKFLLVERVFEKGRENESLFGLGPNATMEGDIVCILYGCSVPVVLREHKTENDDYFQFIGEAYIHGMMDGEALARKRPEHPYLDSETMKLR